MARAGSSGKRRLCWINSFTREVEFAGMLCDGVVAQPESPIAMGRRIKRAAFHRHGRLGVCKPGAIWGIMVKWCKAGGEQSPQVGEQGNIRAETKWIGKSLVREGMLELERSFDL